MPFFFGCLALALAPARSAEATAMLPESRGSKSNTAQSTGAVEGRVQNAVSGRYLNNARVSVKDSNLLVMTDEFGRYVLPRVPSGPAVIEVYYTGMTPQNITLNISAGLTITHDVKLSSAALGVLSGDIVALDPFLVASTKETDGQTIAINEQRFAPNIKNVVATDSFGDVVGGNSVADFLKFIPGVQPSGGQFESESLQMRGFPQTMTVLTSDGGGLATSQVSGNTRGIGLQGFSINNYARVEVTKVPTPATRADTMAGSVNLISKNAFERSRAELRYQVNLTGNSHDLSLKKEPFSDESQDYRINPGFSFDYTLPVNDRFGVVVTAAHATIFNQQNRFASAFSTSSAGTGASISKPFFTTRTLTDGPQYRYRSSLGLRTDWRVTPHGVLSFNAVTSFSRSLWSDNAFIVGTGAGATPTVAGGIPLTYGETFTSGATGRGSSTFRQTYFRRVEANNTGSLRYTFDNGDWKIDALGSKSVGTAKFHNFGQGTFSLVSTVTKVPIRVIFSEIDPKYGPRKVQAFDNNNALFDLYNPNNYNLTTSTDAIRDVRDDTPTANLDVKKRLNSLPFPFSVQAGGSVREIKRDRRLPSTSYTYQGVNGDLSSAPYLAAVYSNQPMPYNDVSRGVPMVSTHRAYEAWSRNPALFTMTTAQLVAAEVSRVTTSEAIQETVNSYYFQAEARLFHNRLQVLTGMRFEKTTDDGRGALQDASAVFVRNADGTFARNAAGARIRKPEAGAAGSLAEAKLIYTERGYRANRSYDGYYPSLHFTYNVTANFLTRAAYARTYGRPNFADIIPNAVTSEADLPDPNTSADLGTITVRNTGLHPWKADNFDLSLDYYTDLGGTFGVSVFKKEIKDFFGQFQKVATLADLKELGLDARYEGWRVTTQTNSGDASVSGLEVSMNHSLQPLGRWGQYFKVFASATKLRLKGNQDANFTGFLPESFNFGVAFAQKRVAVMAKWNYRSEQKNGLFAAYGPDAGEFYKARTQLDVNLSYNFKPNLSLFLNARNVFNVPNITIDRGSQTPAYAQQALIQEYGVPFSIGLKGSF